jgi:ABC-type sugar transport system permease subunit
MSGGGPFESSTVLAYYMYDQATKYYRIGYSAAIAVVLFTIMVVYIVYHLRIKQLPFELIEAARIEGANEWTVFFRIVALV